MPSLAASPTLPIHRDADLCAGLDQPPPDPLAIGDGSALALSGWCFHPHQSVRQLDLEFAGRRCPTVLHGIQRRDLADRFPDLAASRAQWSGFAAVMPIARCLRRRAATLRLIATLDDGRTATTALTTLSLQPEIGSRSPRLISPSRCGSARTAVCMTTYNPDPDLFARQVQSLREQTDPEWICIVCDDGSRPDRWAAIRGVLGDDPRFALYRQDANRGFYRNFEQSLALTPPDCEFVALADQDDRWHPDKLATLQSHFGPRTSLVYSDARIVGADGTVLAPTYWTTRRPNRGDLAALLIANTVTGAAAMIRRRVLDDVLPFPPPFGAAFHDHWLALASLATGEIVYVDRPLYDYVQHRGNVIGHVAPPPLPIWTRAWRWAKFFWPPKFARNVKVALGNGRTHFFDNQLRLQQLSLALTERFTGRLDGPMARGLEKALGIPALTRRACAHPSGVSATVGMEFHLLHARLWAAYMRIKRAALAPRRAAAPLHCCSENR